MSTTKAAYGLLLCSIVALCTFVLKYLFPQHFLISTGYLFAFLLTILVVIMVIYIKTLHGSIKLEEQQMASMFEFATEGIVLANSSGRITLANPAALQLFHYQKEELIGASVEALIPARFQQKHMQYRQGFHEAPANRTMGKGRDLFARKKEGEEFPVEVSLSYYKKKNEVYVIAFIVDITERKMAESQLLQQKEKLEIVTSDIKKLNAELEKKVEERTRTLKEALSELEFSKHSLSDALDKERELNEIKSRFVAMASHEFRTPLSTVLSSAALIGKYHREDEQDKRDKHVRRIRESVQHLNDLLEDFLSLGKLEEGKVETMPDELDVKEFLLDIKEDISSAIKNGQKIKVYAEATGIFKTDKKLLRNILLNLLSNATKFSRDNSDIRVRTKYHKGSLVIDVQDEGIGIPADELTHMFTSFYRASNAINIQGTGLGLHIVKRYVDLLRGKISIHSELEKGTTVTLIIPEMNF